jgi:L-alanine-DL-glutamate epimerase-like enolase superfamily enzyme
LPDASHLAVDAIYSYAPTSRIEAAEALAPLGLWWFEDICDPLDFVPIETGGHP